MGGATSNGRVYDPRIGRFCSADPVLEDPANAQTYNRYSYVRNSPLVYIDPSGYSSWTDFFRQMVQMDYRLKLGPFYSNESVRKAAIQGRSAAAGIIVGIYAGPTAGGAVAGWMQGFEGSLLNGGSLGAAFRSGVTGAAIGAAVGGATGAIGDASKLTNLQRALAHGAVGGAVAELQGGKFAHGFASSFAGSYLSVGSSGSTVSEKVGSTVYAAVVGGTVSVIGGGKFANGAATAAFQHVLNQLAHPDAPVEQEDNENENTIVLLVEESVANTKIKNSSETFGQHADRIALESNIEAEETRMYVIRYKSERQLRSYMQTYKGAKFRTIATHGYRYRELDGSITLGIWFPSAGKDQWMSLESLNSLITDTGGNCTPYYCEPGVTRNALSALGTARAQMK